MTAGTTLLYLHHPDLFESESSILSVNPIDDESMEIILNQTIFHPQGGGQPSDTGTISSEFGAINVKSVKFNGSLVSHICQTPDFQPIVGSNVLLRVNIDARLLHSALHTAGHLIFSIVKHLNMDLVEKKGHHFTTGSYVEFTGNWNGNQDEFTKLVNNAILKDLKVNIFTKDGKRYVQIADFPECPCGGTHLKSLGILKAEIERKRKHLESVSKGAKYVKRSDLEEIKVSVDKPQKEQVEAKKQSPQEQVQVVPLEEIIKRFRAKNEPIKLFDESDSARLLRLAKVESRDESSNGQRNDYLAFLDANEEESELKKIYGTVKNTSGKDLDNPEDDTKLITLDNYSSDPQKVSKLISIYFQRIIRDWEVFLENRPLAEKKSVEGKRVAGNCSQSKEYLKPFFKKLKRGQIDQEILLKIVEICELMQIREYQKANDIYLKLSIGNAAWPIGISGTSIHERSALERIETSKSAGHVLNDETTRKWIQSIKRLMTFTQSVHPSEDFSKNMG